MMFNPTNLGEGFVSIDVLYERWESYREISQSMADTFKIHIKSSPVEMLDRIATRDIYLDIASDLAAEAEGWNEPVNETPEGREYVWHGPVASQCSWGDLARLIAAGEADYDGRIWHAMPKVDRQRYVERVASALLCVRTSEPPLAFLGALSQTEGHSAPIPPIADADAVT